MPRKRKSKPRSADHAALAQAIEILIAEDARMSQDTVADDSGLNIKQINDYIRGQGNPTYATLMKLCQGLHVSPGRLMILRDELREKGSRR